MATMKKGITVPAPQWWKHLRKHYKKLFWKQQRRADRKGLPHADGHVRMEGEGDQG